MSINRDMTKQEKEWLDFAVEKELFAAPRPDAEALQVMASDVNGGFSVKPHKNCCGGHGHHGCCGCHNHK